MRSKWKFLLAPPALALFIGVVTEIVMHLWNWLVPAIFGLHAITFWQSLGLLVLCRMLFGNWGGGRGGRRVWGERWERMTPEERENFRRSMRGRRCGFGGAPEEPNQPA
jgi:hypothetical protein